MVAKDEELKQDLILIDSCIHSLPRLEQIEKTAKQ